MTEACAAGKPVIEALAWFGVRIMSPEVCRRSGIDQLGESLYRAYLAGTVSKAQVRQVFLAHLETSAEAERAVSLISQLAKV